jgi:hypothetical protein
LGEGGGFRTFNGDVPVAFSNSSGKAMIVIFLASSLSGIYPYLDESIQSFLDEELSPTRWWVGYHSLLAFFGEV